MNPVIRRWITILVTLNLATAFAAVYFFETKRQTVHVLRSAQDLADRLASELVLTHEKLEENSDQMKAMEAELKDMRGQNAQLKMQLKQIHLGSVVVEQEPRADKAGAPVEQAGTEPAEGAVMSINHDYNFVIVNLGSQNGIREGMLLSLVQDGSPSAQLRVDMVDDAISAAALVGEPRREIRAGDAVRTILP